MITKEKVKQSLASINGNVDANDIKDNVILAEQGIESLDTFDFFLQVEEEFGVEVNDEQMEELNTVDKIVSYVNKHA